MHSIIYRKENAYNKGLFKNVVIKTGEVFAFISTIFISWCCNFTSSSTMHMKFSHILLTNLQKCLENIIFSRRIEPSVFPEISFWFTLQPKMYFFKHFQRLVNKIQKNVPFRTFFRQNWPISIFFGTPCEGKLGWNQLQYTFPDQWNTFCFMNFAQKLAVEPKSDPKKWHSKG